MCSTKLYSKLRILSACSSPCVFQLAVKGFHLKAISKLHQLMHLRDVQRDWRSVRHNLHSNHLSILSKLGQLPSPDMHNKEATSAGISCFRSSKVWQSQCRAFHIIWRMIEKFTQPYALMINQLGSYIHGLSHKTSFPRLECHVFIYQKLVSPMHRASRIMWGPDKERYMTLLVHYTNLNLNLINKMR